MPEERLEFSSAGGPGPNAVLVVGWIDRFTSDFAFETRDHGATWANVDSITPYPTLGELEVDPADAHSAVFSTPGHAWIETIRWLPAMSVTLHHTTDGVHFETFSIASPCFDEFSYVVPVGGGVLYVPHATPDGTLQFCKSTDAGKTWSPLAATYAGPVRYPSHYAPQVVALPFSAEKDLYFATADFSAASDAMIAHFDESTFTTFGRTPSDWSAGIRPAFNGRALEDLYLARSADLIYHSTDGGNTWTAAGSDLGPATQVNAILPWGAGDAFAVGGYANDQAIILRLQPNGTWKTVYDYGFLYTPAPGAPPAPNGAAQLGLMWAASPNEVYALGSIATTNLSGVTSFQSLIVHGVR